MRANKAAKNIALAIRRPAIVKTGKLSSAKMRDFILERHGYTCQMCGAVAGDTDPFRPGHAIQLTVSYIIEKSKGGSDIPENKRVLCINCYEGLQGLQNSVPPKPRRIELMSKLRRANVDDQLFALNWLKGKLTKLNEMQLHKKDG